jgi:hypothetical protein
MPMNGQVAHPGKVPDILLVHSHADQVRHNVGETLVVVSFDPDHLYVALGVRKFANVTEKFPVFLGESAEVEVRENVTQKDQPPETIVLQHLGRVAGAAALRAQMDVGKDQRIVDGRIHTSFLVRKCYGMMKCR